jgi:hypothetical protein
VEFQVIQSDCGPFRCLARLFKYQQCAGNHIRCMKTISPPWRRKKWDEKRAMGSQSRHLDPVPHNYRVASQIQDKRIKCSSVINHCIRQLSSVHCHTVSHSRRSSIQVTYCRVFLLSFLLTAKHCGFYPRRITPKSCYEILTKAFTFLQI